MLVFAAGKHQCWRLHDEVTNFADASRSAILDAPLRALLKNMTRHRHN